MNLALDFQSFSPRDLVNRINNAADLILISDHLPPGDRINLWFSLAANRPEVAFSAFLTILRDYSDWNYRALALRGLGQISHESTLREMRSCQSERAQQFIRLLADELRGGKNSNDLTRWAAANAMKQIGYNSHSLRQSALAGLGENIERKAKEIVERQIERSHRIQRFASQGQRTADYERYLDFWMFGPVERLFREQQFNEDDVQNLLYELRLWGLGIAFELGSNERIQSSFAYPLLKEVCREYVLSKEKNKVESLYRFLLEEKQTPEDEENFASSLAQERESHDPESLKHENYQELYEIRERTQRKINKLQEMRDVALDSCDLNLPGLKKRIDLDFKGLISHEKSWKLKTEKQIKSLLKIAEINAHNQEVLEEVLLRLESITVEEADSIKGKLVPKDWTHTFIQCLILNDDLRQFKNSLEKSLDEIETKKRCEIRHLEFEIKEIENFGKQILIWALGFFLGALLAEGIAIIVMAVIYVIWFIIAILFAVLGAGSGTG